MIIMLLCVNVMMTTVLGYLAFVQYRSGINLKAQLKELERTIQQVAKDHPVLVHADLVFAQQIRDITAQLVSMDNQIQHLENKRDNDGGYKHALKILEMGGNKEEIIENCHLSRAEAELLMNLQAYRTAIGDVREMA